MWSLRAEKFTWETAAGVKPRTNAGPLSITYYKKKDFPVTLLRILGERRKECLLKSVLVSM